MPRKLFVIGNLMLGLLAETDISFIFNSLYLIAFVLQIRQNIRFGSCCKKEIGINMLLFNVSFCLIYVKQNKKCFHLLTKDNINHIATTVVSLIEKEQENLKLKQLRKSFNNINRKKVNLISAIAECDDSDIRKSLYEELTNLQQQRSIIENEISNEETFVTTLSKSNIKHFLNQLKEGNINDKKHRKSLIATFVKAVYVYDNKVIIFFNNQNNSVEVKFTEVKQVEEFFCGEVRSAIFLFVKS